MTLTTDSQRALTEALCADRIERNVALGPMTTFRIGGPADLLYRARTADELALAIQTARELDVPHFLLGRGANILVGDGGFRGSTDDHVPNRWTRRFAVPRAQRR